MKRYLSLIKFFRLRKKTALDGYFIIWYYDIAITREREATAILRVDRREHLAFSVDSPLGASERGSVFMPELSVVHKKYCKNA